MTTTFRFYARIALFCSKEATVSLGMHRQEVNAAFNQLMAVLHGDPAANLRHVRLEECRLPYCLE